MEPYGVDEYNYEIGITAFLCDLHTKKNECMNECMYECMYEYCIHDILSFIPSYSYKLNKFTELIDITNLDGSPEHFANILWNDCNELRNNPEKDKILAN